MTIDTAWGGRRALVLGASGFIGRWVASRLSFAGADVVSAVRDPRAFTPVATGWRIRGEVHPFDALEDSVADLVDATRPAVVFNLAGYGVDRGETDQRVHERLNTILPSELARILERRLAVRLVHAGSALEYGLHHGVADESVECHPHTRYGETKLAGTQAVVAAASRGLDAIVARLFTVYGPGEHAGRLLPSIREAARRGGDVQLSNGYQRRDFSNVADVAEGLVRLAQQAPGGPSLLNLACGRLTTVREFAATAARLLGIPATNLKFGEQASRPDEMQLEGVSISRLRALTGWSPSDDLESGIRRALAFREDG